MARLRVFEGSAYHVRWSAVFGGTMVAFGLMILLHFLGLAVGFTSLSGDGSLRGMGIGVGIWSIIVAILALFAGAFVASRLAGPVNRGTGIWHGTVVWGLTSLGSLFLVTMALVPAMRAGASAAGSAVSAAQSTVSSAVSSASIDKAIGPINDRLRSQGMPTVTAPEVRSAAQDAMNTAIQEGRMDKNVLAQAISRNTRLSRADAETLANDLQGQVQSLYGQAAQTGQAAAKVASGLLWALFLASLLSLGSSVLGSFLGVTREQRFEAEHLAASEQALEQGVPPVLPTQPPRAPVDPGRH